MADTSEPKPERTEIATTDEESARLRRRVRGLQLRSMRPLFAGASRLVVLTDFEVDLYAPCLEVG